MREGRIRTPPGTGAAVDLKRTVESGQTFFWRRAEGHGKMFDDRNNPTYITIALGRESPTGDPEAIRVRQPTPDELHWEAWFDAEPIIRRRLRLDDDLDAIRQSLPDHAALDRAFDAQHGLRVPQDPLFPTLIAFICSAQMSVPRIHGMQLALAEAFGELTAPVEGTESQYYAFPTRRALADASEDDLRALKLGYRAPYVTKTATQALDVPARNYEQMSYHEAHEALQEYTGVGDKVADCVQLYALGHLNAFPVDTWIERALAAHFPDIVGDSYMDTGDAARDYFGDYAGYAQSYLFAHTRAEADV